MELLEKLRSRYVVNAATGCWEWTGTTSRGGYGVISTPIRKGWYLAHRLAYELLRGPIPDGLQIDHLCRVRHCVNPDHLEPVTNRENTTRGLAPALNRARLSGRTHCKHGHELSPDNVRISRRGARICRTCAREEARKRAGGLTGTRAAGPSRLVLSRSGRTLALECGHSVLRNSGRTPKRAQCEICESQPSAAADGLYHLVREAS